MKNPKFMDEDTEKRARLLSEMGEEYKQKNPGWRARNSKRIVMIAMLSKRRGDDKVV